jgi:hypothetical protein
MPLNIPFNATPDTSNLTRQSDLERAIVREEAERARAFVREQHEAQRAREAEIFARESAQRERLRQAVGSGEPATSLRITSRTPAWEQESRLPNARQPSPASSPPTPNTSGAASSSDLSMEAMPSTAAPRSAVDFADPRPVAHPANVPDPAGAIGAAAVQQIARNAAVGGVGAAAADLTYNVITGQRPIGDALGHAVFTGGGTAAGAALGSAFGPVGMFLGGAIGGAVGGALYDRFSHPPTAQPQKEPKTAPPPFTGGQSPGVVYKVWVAYATYVEVGGYAPGSEIGPASMTGPITGTFINTNNPGTFQNAQGIGLVHGNNEVFMTSYTGRVEQNIPKVTRVERADGQPDTGGSIFVPLSTDNRTPQSTAHPGNYTYAPPTGVPQESPNTAPNNYAPGGLPIIKLPHARPVGQEHPDTAAPPMQLPGYANPGAPNSSGAPSNNVSQNPLGGSVTYDPTTGTVVFVAPGSPQALNPALNPQSQSLPFTSTPFEAFVLTSTNFNTTPNPDHNTISGTGTTTRSSPQPDNVNPIPRPQQSTTTTTFPTTDIERLRTEFQEQLTNLGLGLYQSEMKLSKIEGE